MCRDSVKIAFWIPLRSCFKSSSFSPSAWDFPSSSRATHTAGWEPNVLKTAFHLPSGWALATCLLTISQLPPWVSNSGLEWGEIRGGAGKALTAFSGLELPEAGQDKITRVKAGAASLADSTWPWHWIATSDLLCQIPYIPQKRGFAHYCFFFFEGGVWGKGSLNCIEDILIGLKWIQKAITKVMKREGWSCNDEKQILDWEKNSPRRKNCKSRSTSRTEGLLSWRREKLKKELKAWKDAQVSQKNTGKGCLLLSAQGSSEEKCHLCCSDQKQLCCAYNKIQSLSSAFEEETIQFSTRMNIHL